MGRPLTPEELAEFEARRKAQNEKTANALGMSAEYLDEIRRKAAEEVHADDSWEKELNRKNRAKAGIE